MAYGYTTTGSVRVYAYGAPKGVLEGAEAVDEQMILAHRYKNALVAIERRRREGRRQAFQSHQGPAVAALRDRIAEAKAQLAEARQEIKQHRMATRSRATPAEWKQRRADIQRQLQGLRGDMRAARKDATLKSEALRAELKRIEQAARDEGAEARRRSGLYWGTYLEMGKHVEATRKAYNDPQFHRHDGSGAIAVQLQGGIAVARALSGEDRRLQVAVALPGKHAQVRLRVGSKKDKSPIWATVPIVLHRPLPEEGRIKWVRLVRRRVGRRVRHSVQFTISFPGSGMAAAPRDGTVAADINWRLLPEGLRVATWVGNDGETGHIILPKTWLDEMDRVQGLQATRDKLFNHARADLTAWMRRAPSLPDWLTEDTRTIQQWRAIGRLVGLVTRWRDRRFAGDEEIRSHLEAWRSKELHLFEWETHLREQLLNRRREIYRVSAARLGDRYGTCVLENMDLRKFARQEGPMERVADAVRSLRQKAALHSLRQALRHKLRIVTIPAMHTTRTCHGCGHVQKRFNAARRLRYRCEACRLEWDQDENAARNMLQRHLGGSPAYGRQEGGTARISRPIQESGMAYLPQTSRRARNFAL